MALREPLMVKTVVGAADLSLRADVGESLLIKGIYTLSNADVYATTRIEKTVVGYFRASNLYGNHIPFPSIYKPDQSFKPCLKETLMDYLYRLGVFKGYPVAEGETFYLSGLNHSADVKTITYELWDAGDKKPEDPNGSRALEYFFINYGDTGTDITIPGDHTYDVSLNPIEFPAFPYGVDVPAKTKIDIHGILGKEIGVRNVTPATAIYTKYLKFVKERITLFDKERDGLIFDFSNALGGTGTRYAGGQSIIGDMCDIDPRHPCMFPTPLSFDAGEEMVIYVTVAEPIDGSVISRSWQVLGIIETVRRE